MNEVLKTIKNRRSVRTYNEEQIKKDELDLIIEAGTYAPSGHNRQPWYFTVIQNRDMIRYIGDKSKELMAMSDIRWIRKMGLNKKLDITYGAPTLVLVSGKKEAISWQVDCSAAIQNMLLAAESLNIGSVWLGLISYFLRSDSSTKILQIPEGYEPYYGVALGYKAAGRRQTVPKRKLNVVQYL